MGKLDDVGDSSWKGGRAGLGNSIVGMAGRAAAAKICLATKSKEDRTLGISVGVSWPINAREITNQEIR